MPHSKTFEQLGELRLTAETISWGRSPATDGAKPASADPDGELKVRKPILLVVGLIALAYESVAVTPLKALIGRSRPEVAAAFSPPWFNFHAQYSADEVLDFKIGMNREQFREIVKGYTGVATLAATCGGGTKASMVQLDQPEALALLQRDVVCLWSDSRRLSLIFNFRDSRVDRIEVSLVNAEII